MHISVPGMNSTLSIATWNIHKGFSQFNRRMMVHELRDRLRELSADIDVHQACGGPAQGGRQRKRVGRQPPEELEDTHAAILGGRRRPGDRRRGLSPGRVPR